MAIELSEEAFFLLHSLKEQLEQIQGCIDSDPPRAKEDLATAISELADWIGPGMP